MQKGRYPAGTGLFAWQIFGHHYARHHDAITGQQQRPSPCPAPAAASPGTNARPDSNARHAVMQAGVTG